MSICHTDCNLWYLWVIQVLSQKNTLKVQERKLEGQEPRKLRSSKVK
jgi:hypothetical protein